MRTLPSLTLAAALMLGSALPAWAGSYATLDPQHSRIGFTYTQMGVAMNGSFGQLKGQVQFDPAKPEAAKASLTVPLASIQAGSAEANDEVKGKAWFNTAAYPTAQFDTTQVKALGGNRYQVSGKLTLKGRSHEVSAPFTLTPQGKAATFEGGFILKRTDFAVGEGSWADGGIVAHDVRITFSLRVLAAEAR